MTVYPSMATLALGLAIAAPLGAAAQSSPRVNPIGAAVHGFQARLSEYVKVHKLAQSRVPTLAETADPTEIARREAALGEVIRGLRAGARQGDLFTDDLRPVLIRAIHDDFEHRSAVDRKALVQELPPRVTLAVNMTYPQTLPLATVPAKLLRALPDLPPELEYRIVGRHLILRDVKANIVVDYVPNVVPTIPS